MGHGAMESITLALAGIIVLALVVGLVAMFLYLVEVVMVFSLRDIGFDVGLLIMRRGVDRGEGPGFYRNVRGDRLRLSTTEVRWLNPTRLIFTFRGPEPRLRSSRVPIKGVVWSRNDVVEIAIRIPLGLWILIHAWALACAAGLLLATVHVVLAPGWEALWIVLPAGIGLAIAFWVRPFFLNQARQMARRCSEDVLRFLGDESE